MRWISNPDLLRVLQEAVAVAGLPVNRVDGRRQPYEIELGLGAAPGHLSRCEYVDFVVCLPITATEFARRLASALPPGLEVLWQRRLSARTPSLKTAPQRYRYILWGAADPERAAAFHGAETWPWTRLRKGRARVLDLKQSVSRLRVEPGRVILDIVVREEGTPKPEEVYASVFGVSIEEAMLLPAERADTQPAPPPFLALSRD